VAGDEVPGGGRFARLRGARPALPWRRRDDGAPRVAFTKDDARRLNARFAELDRADRRACGRFRTGCGRFRSAFARRHGA
jgi:hypothetical protein